MPDSYLSQWSWVGFGSVSKGIETRYGAMTEAGEYGTRYHLDQTMPNEEARFEGKLLTLTEIMAIRVLAMTPLGEYSVTTDLGQTWTGLITSFDPAYIEGSEYFTCQITLLNCTVTGP